MLENTGTEVEVPLEEKSYLESAFKLWHSLATKVGRTERDRHQEIDSKIFLGELIRHGGTFYWKDGPNAGYKFDTIWEALAAEMPDFAEKDFNGKFEWVKEYSPKLKRGFYSARDWSMEWNQNTIYYSVTYRIITLDPNYVLPNGMTAAEAQNEQDSKRVAGQLKASVNRVTASGGDAVAFIDVVAGKVRESIANSRADRALPYYND